MIETDKMQLYEKYKEKVKAYVSGKVSHVQDAEDLVSTVFLKIYQNSDKFDASKAKLSTWIYAITRNTVIDYFRTRKVYCELEEISLCEESITETLEAEDMLEMLCKALEKLPKKHRDLIILHYYTGKTLKEISVSLGMSYINAKITHKKALNRLNKLLSDELKEGDEK